ncbi:MAG: DUF5817 domain-containing protein [Haloarculaceae archaeon]
MYRVVGCRDCSALWVLEGRPETTQCPRCRTRHPVDRLRAFAETETAAAAKDARSRLLADREGERLDDDFEALGRAAMDAGPDDEAYLEASGVDSEAAADAADRAGAGAGSGPGSRREVVLAALRALDSPTADEVADYAAERGVPREWTREALDRLARAGEVTRSGGRYRLL